MRRAVILLCCMLPLTGCIPVMLAAGAAAGGAAIVSDKRSVKTIMRDRNITQTAQNLLNNAPELKHQIHISIATFDGSVLMVGQTKTATARQRAYEIVSKVKYVRRVYNQVTLGDLTRITRRADDAWITTKVHSKLLTTKGLSSAQIKVVTEDGVVYLMGLVGEKQAQLAANAARHVSGVRKVVKAFEYL